VFQIGNKQIVFHLEVEREKRNGSDIAIHRTWKMYRIALSVILQKKITESIIF